jgi:hypothetical protein
MKANPIALSLGTILLGAAAWAQSAPASQPSPQYSMQGTALVATSAPQGAAVSYASVTQLSGMLSQLDSTSKTTQIDLAKLRIEKWKTDGATKKQTLGDVDSVQRNLQNALPEMMELYRNLDALYDVLGGLVESAGAFGPKDDFQSLSNDLNGFEGTRKQLAERMNTLAASKEQEIVRLRADLKTAQAAIAAAPPKKVVVDDNERAKKPAPKKKPAAKKPAAAGPSAAPATTPPPQPRPQ